MHFGSRGVMDTTMALVAETHRTMLPAIFGTSAAIAAPFITSMLVLSGDLTAAQAAAISIIPMVVGYFAGRPWRIAMAALEEHTDKLKAENAARGNGWARS